MTDTVMISQEAPMVTIDAKALGVALAEYQKRDSEQPHPVDYPLVYAIIAYLQALASPPSQESRPGEGRGLREALEQALRQWKMYAELETNENGSGRDLRTEQTPEGTLYRDCLGTYLAACPPEPAPAKADAPGHTDLMMPPERITDEWLAKNPLPADDGWVRIDEAHLLPDDLSPNDRLRIEIRWADSWQEKQGGVVAYRRRSQE